MRPPFTQTVSFASLTPYAGATANLELEKFEEVIQDADKAIELNPEAVKVRCLFLSTFRHISAKLRLTGRNWTSRPHLIHLKKLYLWILITRTSRRCWLLRSQRTSLTTGSAKVNESLI
jgi:hypothetical protein